MRSSGGSWQVGLTTCGSLNEIRSGELGQTTGQRGIPDFGKPKPIKVSYVRGTTTERALVIAGVHGTEQQGIEVAETLLRILPVTAAALHRDRRTVPVPAC